MSVAKCDIYKCRPQDDLFMNLTVPNDGPAWSSGNIELCLHHSSRDPRRMSRICYSLKPREQHQAAPGALDWMLDVETKVVCMHGAHQAPAILYIFFFFFAIAHAQCLQSRGANVGGKAS